jgi:hypothetical protein
MPYETRTPENQSADFNSGPYLARVISNIDPKYMGTLQVQLLRDVGNIPESEGSLFQVKYLSPFYGVTNLDHVGKNNTFGDTQKSYGMWMVPPDVGVMVLVIFVEGDPKQGYWIGCVQDEFMNFMVPGLAATEINTENPPGKKPVGEFNKKLNTLEQDDPTQVKKPVHPFAAVLTKQGLLTDEHRGITTSSARRESPSNVFGISTPGPIDRSSGAPRGNIGTKENKIGGAFVSRKGGTTLVMDDGDDNFLRKTHASEGPPAYASVENGEKGGNTDIPHNELFRIRTRTGHQILLHNSEDLIYIGNARGTTWIELTSNGKIDIYAEDSVSIHTKADLNITADNNINLTAKNDVNIKAGNNFNAKAGADYNIKAGADGKLTVGGQSNIKAGGNHVETAAQIHMNGPGADAAADAIDAPRVPEHEPWAGHENLHGKTASKMLDTFKKIGK